VNPKAVTLSLIVVGVIVTVDELASGRAPKPQTYVGLLAVFLALSLLANAAPGLAGPLALLILAVTILTRGPHVLGRLAKR
jgi:hypothetical protein